MSSVIPYSHYYHWFLHLLTDISTGSQEYQAPLHNLWKSTDKPQLS